MDNALQPIELRGGKVVTFTAEQILKSCLVPRHCRVKRINWTVGLSPAAKNHMLSTVQRGIYNAIRHSKFEMCEMLDSTGLSLRQYDAVRDGLWDVLEPLIGCGRRNPFPSCSTLVRHQKIRTKLALAINPLQTPCYFEASDEYMDAPDIADIVCDELPGLPLDADIPFDHGMNKVLGELSESDSEIEIGDSSSSSRGSSLRLDSDDGEGGGRGGDSTALLSPSKSLKLPILGTHSPKAVTSSRHFVMQSRKQSVMNKARKTLHHSTATSTLRTVTKIKMGMSPC